MDNLGDRFLSQCKVTYLKGITPSNPIHYHDIDYQALINIGKEYIKTGKLKELAEFFMEGQYFIPLWAAHIILEYGMPDEHLAEECLETIKEYSDNPLSPEVSMEEQKWLKIHFPK